MAQIKFVRLVSNHVGAKADRVATDFARPEFRSFEEMATNAPRAYSFVDHQSADFRARIRFHAAIDEHPEPARDFATLLNGNEDGVLA